MTLELGSMAEGAWSQSLRTVLLGARPKKVCWKVPEAREAQA